MVPEERIKDPPVISTGVWTEIEDEVMGNSSQTGMCHWKDRVKSFTQSIYEYCKEKLGIAT